MRITESRMIELAATSVADARDRAGRAQEALSSGVRVERPSDDVAAWAAGERASIRRSQSQGRGQAIGLATENLQQTDGVLAVVSDGLSQLGTLASSGANGGLNAADRVDIAQKVRALRDSAMAALNQKGPDGSYLLSGSKGDVAAFSPLGGYQGDGASRSVSVAEGQTAPGAVTAQRLTTANGGVDVLSVFDQVANALDANDPTTVTSLMATIQQATGQVTNLRSLVGERLTALNGAEDARQSFEQNLAEQHANAVEVDPIAAASDLTRASTVLESARAAAQQIVSMMQSG